MGALDPAYLEAEWESGEVSCPTFAWLKIVFPVGRCGDAEGNMDGFVEIVNNGEVGHSCTLRVKVGFQVQGGEPYSEVITLLVTWVSVRLCGRRVSPVKTCTIMYQGLMQTQAARRNS